MNTELFGAFPALEEQSTAAGLGVVIQAQADALGRLAQDTELLAAVVDAAVMRLGAGEGRLVYAGAGASGRIAVQDGVELWPTFGWPHARLAYLMAGGSGALVNSMEGAEDDETAARADVDALNLGPEDVVIGLAASGNTPYVAAVLERAQQQGALSVSMFNNPDCRLARLGDFSVYLDSGPEVINGSTRLNAASTQKAALNAFSTLLMVRLNRTHQNIMVDMAADNLKLADRRVRMIQAIDATIEVERARELLTAAGGSVKVAVGLSLGLSLAEVEDQLARAGGRLASLLESR